MICVSLGKTGYKEAVGLAAKMPMMELRADMLDWSRDEYYTMISRLRSSVFTFRPGTITEKERLEMYRFAIECGVNYIDVEMEVSVDFLSEIRRVLKGSRTELILSYHNYEGTPSRDEQSGIMESGYSNEADVVKLATMVDNYSDAAVLLSMYSHEGRKLVIGMGEKGKIVRIAAGFLGAEFTFAAIEKGEITAPGQMTWYEMEEIYKIINSGL